jgi:predicted dehydrogenase
LRHGKHVLCEKPLALNLRQAEAMMAAAEAAGRFLMEALVTACFPAVDRLRTLVHDGTIGRLEGIEASYGLEVPYDPEHRMFAPALGGGALLDLGVYPLAMATLVVDGAPLHIESTVRRAPSGVDDHVSMLVHYADSVTAHLVCASRQELPRKAVFVGSRGRIVVPPPFSTPGQLEVWPAQGDAQTHVFETQGAGYALEADEVRDCLRAGRLESPRWPWSASRAVLSIADAVRNEHGLTYPAD